MSLYCIACRTDHDYDLMLDDGTCIVCGDQLVEDDEELPSVETQMQEVLEVVDKLNVVKTDVGIKNAN